MDDCVGLHSYDRCMSGPTFSCKLALAHASGILHILSLTSVVGADWNCRSIGIVLPPIKPDATKKYRFSFSSGGGAILAVSQMIGDGLSTNLYDVSSFASIVTSAVSGDAPNGGVPSVCCISFSSELKRMADEQNLCAEALGVCLLSSPSSQIPTLVTTHKGLATGKIVLWDTASLSPTDFIDTPLTLTGILQSGGGSSNNNTRFSLSGTCEDQSIGILECSTPTRSVVRMSGRIGKGKRWCLARGGDFLAAIVGGEGDFEEGLQMTTLQRSIPEVKMEHESKRRKFDPLNSPPLFSELPKCHEFEITAMCISGSDSLIATGDSFGSVYIHGSIS
ncbi:hypothetical protein TrCOL_g10078 [Triparma columacea]|uniref:Uncharacterized protein n=1 Tax=Triparma columacea TaxID=722753 RepID=A0A9W7LBW3_9STRA|nr:hypothetical protein TrCOL_g10078 [Triparma columacea]